MKKIFAFVLVLGLLCGCLTGCSVPSFSELMGKQDKDSETADYEKKLDELMEIIDRFYVDDYDEKVMGDYLAQAAVAATGDQWSYYISADQYAEYLEDANNAYVGIGVTVRLVNEDDEGITIVEVNKGGSAHDAGLLPGDMVVSVDGQNAVEIGVDAMSDLIRGEEGTELTIRILRDGEYMDVPMVRKLIEVEVVAYENLDGIGYIKIDNFQSRCAEMTIAAIEALLAQNVEGLIFDLRYNPGGRKADLVQILDYILPEGPLFRSVNYDGKEYVDTSDGASVVKLPMVVMVNQDSYSAAEFFAAAMQEYEWAIIVGSQTVGKGNYQQTFTMSDGSAVAISTGHYSTPKGVNLEGVGITPDIVVDVDDETYVNIYLSTEPSEDDPQLQAALEVLSN